MINLNKPSWDDAPEWANWLAMDSDGAWYWYEKKPYIDESIWDMQLRSRVIKAEPLIYDEWENSLEARNGNTETDT